METAEERNDIRNKRELSYFDRQRSELIGKISTNLEQVLQALNKLNRSLEGVIAVGNELGSVEALWTQFESVMARNPEESNERDGPKNAT